MRIVKFCCILSLVLLLAACGRQLPDSTPVPASAPAEDSTSTTEDSTTAESTPEASQDTAETVDTEEEVSDQIIISVRQANPANGEALYNEINSTGFACASCHSAVDESRLLGPGLYNIAIRGETRVEGDVAERYIYNSILHPNDYIVEAEPEYPQNLMPQNYEELYTDAQIYDIIAYLMTLRDEVPAVAQADTEETADDADAEATDDTDAEATDDTDAEATDDTDAEATDDTDAEATDDTDAEATDDTDAEATDDTDAEATDDTDAEATDDTDTEATDDTDAEATDDTDAEATDDTDVETTDEPVVEEDSGEPTAVQLAIAEASSGDDASRTLRLVGVGNADFGAGQYNEALAGDVSCADCHSIDGTNSEDGPTLAGYADYLAETFPDALPQVYIYNAILSGDFHGDLYETFVEENTFLPLANITAYVMTLEAVEVAESADTADEVEETADTEETADESTDEAVTEEETADSGDEAVSELAEFVAAADVANGEALYNEINSTGFACSSCHNVANQERLIGPGLAGIPTRAAERVEGQSALEYIYNSILHPNDYIVEGDPEYPENLMPMVYAELYSEEQIYDIVAYLMTLEEE